MTGYIKEPHTTMFIDQTPCFRLKKNTTNFLTTLSSSAHMIDKTYHAKGWIKNDDKV